MRADKTPYFCTVDSAKNTIKMVKVTPGLELLRGYCHRLSTTTQNMTAAAKRRSRRFKNVVACCDYFVAKINKSNHKSSFDPTLQSYCKTRFWTLWDELRRISCQYNKFSNVITNYFDMARALTFGKADLDDVLPIFESLMSEIKRLEKQTEPTIQRIIPSLMFLSLVLLNASARIVQGYYLFFWIVLSQKIQHQNWQIMIVLLLEY